MAADSFDPEGKKETFPPRAALGGVEDDAGGDCVTRQGGEGTCAGLASRRVPHRPYLRSEGKRKDVILELE